VGTIGALGVTAPTLVEVPIPGLLVEVPIPELLVEVPMAGLLVEIPMAGLLVEVPMPVVTVGGGTPGAADTAAVGGTISPVPGVATGT